MKLLLPLLLLCSTVTAQFTSTQLAQIQNLIRDSMNAERVRTTNRVRDSMNRERAFVRTEISRISIRTSLGEWRDIRDSATNFTQAAQIGFVTRRADTLRLQMNDVLNILNNRALIPDSSGFTFEGKRFRPKLDSTAAAAIATAIVEAFKEKQVRFNTGIDTRVTEAERQDSRLLSWAIIVAAFWNNLFKETIPQP
jgi:hypothetical protein